MRKPREWEETEIDAREVRILLSELELFMKPYLPLFGRSETDEHALRYVRGRLQQLNRRTIEPIATKDGVVRRPLQMFVGAGVWADEPVLGKLCEDVAETLGTSDGVLVMDGSGFQKWGNKSVGVQRQWCGRLGKTENCQVGQFLVYASRKGETLVDRRLYLPKSWATDKQRRAEAHVPRWVKFRKGWELAHEMVQARSAALPHAWVVGDDEYGRVVALRKRLAADGERYLLEVPCDTRVRLDSGDSKTRRVDAVAYRTPLKDWERVRVRDGEKGPIEVQALRMRVTTGTGDNARRETLLIVRQGPNRHWYYLSNARGFSVAKMAKVAACRHYIEEVLRSAKGEVGLAEYEVRSWVGWHHHMTLSLLAMFFLVCQQKRLKKNSSTDHSSSALRHGPLAQPQREDTRSLGSYRTTGNLPTAEKRRGASCPLSI